MVATLSARSPLLHAHARAVDTIVLAFATDPVARWCWPEASQYLTAMPRFIQAFGGQAFDHNTAWWSDDFEAAALWLPPGVGPDEEGIMALLHQTIPEQRHPAVLAVLEQMGASHPAEPHWYLPLIGADPGFQNQGHGSRLLRLALDRCDREGLPAYLESSSPRNIPLYRRHGFEAATEIGEVVANGPRGSCLLVR